MFKKPSLLVILSTVTALSACGTTFDMSRHSEPVVRPTIKMVSPVYEQSIEVAAARARERDLRAEVVGNIDYLKSHLGEHRSHILDLNDSLLVTLPGKGAFQNRTERLTDEGIDAIARIAASMQAYPHTRIAVVGHVTGSKSAYADQILSERRATAVKSVLLSYGVDECRIGLLGKGSRDFVSAPFTERRDQHNDRIELLMKPYQDGACV